MAPGAGINAVHPHSFPHSVSVWPIYLTRVIHLRGRVVTFTYGFSKVGAKVFFSTL